MWGTVKNNESQGDANIRAMCLQQSCLFCFFCFLHCWNLMLRCKNPCDFFYICTVHGLQIFAGQTVYLEPARTVTEITGLMWYFSKTASVQVVYGTSRVDINLLLFSHRGHRLKGNDIQRRLQYPICVKKLEMPQKECCFCFFFLFNLHLNSIVPGCVDTASFDICTCYGLCHCFFLLCDNLFIVTCQHSVWREEYFTPSVTTGALLHTILNRDWCVFNHLFIEKNQIFSLLGILISPLYTLIFKC